jgi:hypothetical protein
LRSFEQCQEFFLDLRKPHPPESALCEPRWASKTPAVPGSYKRCTPDSNSRPAVQISNSLPSRHAPWVPLNNAKKINSTAKQNHSSH